MKTSHYPILFALSIPLFAFGTFGGNPRKTTVPAGAVEVPLNPADPNPLVSVPNGTTFNANDLHFELQPKNPAIDKSQVKVVDANGNDMGWNTPTGKNGKYDMTMKPSGTTIPAGGGGGLSLKSKTNGGWSKAFISLTQNGRTIYPPKILADTPGILKTGNRFPVTLGALANITNGGTLAITQIQLSLNTTQSLVEIGSDRPGFGVPTDGVYVFEEPILPGDSADLWWSYDDFSNTPLQDTEVTLTPITEAQILAVQAPSNQPSSKTKRSQLRSWKMTEGSALLPPMKVIVLNPKEKKTVLLSRGAYTFEAKGAAVKLLKGSAKIGQPFVSSFGELVVPFSGASKPFSFEVSGLVGNFGGKTKKGLVRIYLKGKHSDLRVKVGYRR